MITLKNSCLLFLLALLCSCGTSRKLFNKDKRVTDSTIKIDERWDMYTVDEYAVDSNIELPTLNLTGLVDVPLNEHDTATLENGDMTITATKDKRTGKLRLSGTTKPKTVPILIKGKKTTHLIGERTTEIEVHKKEKTVMRDKERTGLQIPWYTWVVIALIGCCVGGYYISKLYKKMVLTK